MVVERISVAEAGDYSGLGLRCANLVVSSEFRLRIYCQSMSHFLH